MDLMDQLVPRADTTCTGDTLWYVCSAGDYKGCCSSNPCTLGVCPDDDTTISSTDTTTFTASSTSSHSSTSTSPTENTTTAIAKTTSSSTSTTGSTSPSTIVAATSTSTSTTAPASSSSSNHSAIIGGAIGGLAGLLIIAIILFCFWKRRNRMKNTEPCIIDQSQWPNPRKTPWQRERTGNYNGNSKHNAIHPKEKFVNIRTKGSSYPHFEPSVTDSHNNTVISALTGGPNTSTTSLSLNGGATCFQPIPSIPTAELLASVPKRAGYTPELPDTRARRACAELPTDPQRDLINMPLNQRQGEGVMLYQRGDIANVFSRDSLELFSASSSPKITSSSPGSGSGSVSGFSPPSRNMSPRFMARHTARRVVTEEEVVMGANLGRYSGNPKDTELSIENWNGIDNGNKNGNGNGDADMAKGKENSGESQDHVMSFMNFDGSLPLTDVSDGEAGQSSTPISPPTAVSASPPTSSPVSNKIGNLSFMDVGPLSPTPSEVPPAYEAEEECEFEVNGERKTPAGTMGLGVRRFD
ncbi:uncharacterized protein N7484_007554 [Penicillium longicatenatum]|uniref:uncharacterized protein n=1 Tax=Penicillium longicatenatum TaxID=1561947 RepID=UPI00254852A3|nr:uncharacterized protein N7484_007554 [Penicillium longicatenatum]KAJ5639692.1 hypothetical protein N7484_007554 [Penicillium longicatenatum]